MQTINVLVDDESQNSRSIINRGIGKFNTFATERKIVIIGETESAESGIEIIQKEVLPIHLVFLDYNLLGENGFLLSRKFPGIPYIIVSTDPRINKLILEEEHSCQYTYMKHISDGHIFSSDERCSCKWFKIGIASNGIH